jgi:hypothetical protein
VSSQFVLAGRRRQFGSDSAEGFRYTSALYHMLARSSDGREMVQNDQDQQRFLKRK